MKYILSLSLALSLILQGCGSNSSSTEVFSTPTPTRTFQVSIANITNNQPLSPVALIVHNSSHTDEWTVGSLSNSDLTSIAEIGDNAAFLATAKAKSSVISTQSLGGVSPKTMISAQISTPDSNDLHITSATMLVNTNDAFTGVLALQIGNLAVNQEVSKVLQAYDAGSELNDELASRIPGPAGDGSAASKTLDGVAGEGFINIHSGVVTSDDGLSSSALNVTHRFSNPATITIKRIN